MLIKLFRVNQSIFSNNKRIIAVALALAILVFSFYNKDLILGFFSKDGDGVRLATVTSLKNEVRKKKNASLNWKSANLNEKINRGDSISTGQVSTAMVKFNNGQSLSLDQNTLIVFDQERDTPEFITGNIKLSVNGSMKIKIDNEIVTIDGTNAEIQIYKDPTKNKQKIVLLKGASQVTSVNNTIRLEKNKITDSKEIVFKPEAYKALLKQEQDQRTQMLSQQLAAKQAAAPITPPVREPTAAQVYNYKLYDFYKRMVGTGLEFSLNKTFTLRPNGQFAAFNSSNLKYADKVSLKKSGPTYAQFEIKDTTLALGYIVEISANQVFTEETTKYIWAGPKFQYPFESEGTYYLRYRKVLSGQQLTDYSTSENFKVAPSIDELKLARLKRIKKTTTRSFKLNEPKSPVVEKPVEIVQKPEPVLKLEPTARKPAAIQQGQSAIKLGTEQVFKNMKFTDSYVDTHFSQGFQASNRQIENNRTFSQSFNLGFDIVHWKYDHGVKAEIGKSIVSSERANSVLMAEIDYMYRVFVASKFADGNRAQIAGIAGYEMYQNSSASSDFLSSYSLFKFGLGASLPLFSFWNAELTMMFGMGAGNTTSIQYNTRLNYYLKQNLSLGLGFKARKYDFVLLNKKNIQSFSETYTSLRYHY